MSAKALFMTKAHEYCKVFTSNMGGNYHVNLGQIMKLMYLTRQKGFYKYHQFKKDIGIISKNISLIDEEFDLQTRYVDNFLKERGLR